MTMESNKIAVAASGEVKNNPVDGKRKTCEDVAEDLRPTKKINDELKIVADADARTGKLKSLNGLAVDSVLSNSADYKRIVVEATLNEQKAVVILDKKPFVEESFSDLFSERSELVHTFQNDIYGSYDCIPDRKASSIKATIVYPATQRHIEKYKQQPWFLIDETPEIYKKVTLPFLESSSFDIQWVFNILEHKKEKDRIVFEDPCKTNGFILLPDLKWDGITLENLYLVAIIHQKGIKSLRDLKEGHLPLLKNILETGSKAINDKYGLTKSKLRIYIHYQPSYYHLHVHFTALSFNAAGINTEKAHLLQTVISNISGNPSYYQEAILPFTVAKNHQLYTKFEEDGYEF